MSQTECRGMVAPGKKDQQSRQHCRELGNIRHLKFRQAILNHGQMAFKGRVGPKLSCCNAALVSK